LPLAAVVSAARGKHYFISESFLALFSKKAVKLAFSNENSCI